MGIAGLPKHVKLISGILISKPEDTRDKLFHTLSETFGPIDQKMIYGHFDKTDYYKKEMGTPLYRYYLSFTSLVPPEKLPGIKLKTNAIETTFLNDHGGRQVNIDPGILTLQNLVLATTKNYTHRIYLGKGIYGDLTLIFQKGEYVPLPWTYPDYREKKVRAFFLEIRNRYKDQLKGASP